MGLPVREDAHLFLMATLPRITANELLQVSIVGQIVGGTELGDGASGSAHCNWRLVAQPGWKHLFGEVAGASQSDMPDTSQSDMPESTMYVWCHPLDACFECENVRAQEAWPRLELEVRWRDIYDRSDLEGYGVVSVPPLPGVHQLVCRLWRPRGSMRERFVAYVMGGRPHLKNNGLVFGVAEEMDNGGKQLARAVGERRLLTEPAGTVHISLAVCVQRKLKPDTD